MEFEAGGIVAILLLGFWIWAILDVIATDSALCRNLPKGVWLILVLILPVSLPQGARPSRVPAAASQSSSRRSSSADRRSVIAGVAL